MKLAAFVLTSFVVLHCALNAIADEPSREELKQEFATTVRPFLKTYCFECHGEEVQEAKLDLSVHRSIEHVTRAHQTWQILLERLESNEMPPKDAALHPKVEQRQAVIDWIRAARRHEAIRNAGDPGPVLVRRLSNAELNYTIRDLTGVDIRPADTFPVDPANEAGFDNSGESLAMSPALLKKYLGAARQVTEHLVLKPRGIDFAPHPVVTDTDRDKYCVNRIVEFYQRQPTDYSEYFLAAWRFKNRAALGMPNAKLADVATQDGVSQKYLSLVWETLEGVEETVGPIAKLQTMWRELPSDTQQEEAARVGSKTMRDFVVGLRRKLEPKFENLVVEGNHKGSQTFVLWKNRQYASHRRTCNLTAITTRDDPTADELAANDLLIPAAKAERSRYESAFERFCSTFPDAFYVSERGRDYLGTPKDQQEKGRLLSAGFHSMMGYFRDDMPLYELVLDAEDQRELDLLWLELDFIAFAPTRQYVGFLWFERTDSRYMRDPVFDFARAEDKNASSESMIKELAKHYLAKARRNNGSKVAIKAIDDYFKNINRQIRHVEAARIRAEPSHVEAVLEFAGRAYRRPLTDGERNELIGFYHSRRDEDGLSHEEAIQDTIVAVLMSPFFCYRTDLAADGERRALTDVELASRLSYFLWSSMPDERLLDVAAAGKLRQPDVLLEQTRRMLGDPRAVGLATEFGGNWLDFRRFEQLNSVDRDRFPDFTDELRRAMFEEPVRFFADVVASDRSVFEFLDADHTFVNAVLARHYGMKNVYAGEGAWVRVDRAADYDRGGLLPMSVFLTKNAPGLRTSPVKRGYWVVRRLLGERIPPPPPNVPELPNDETKLGELSLREVLAKHREHKSCAGCHDRFDSIGLAFEGFGPVGERREKDLAGRTVDDGATFPGGGRGVGIDGLRRYLREHRREEFLDNLCRKLLSYALGRTLLLSDESLIDEMKTNLAADEYRIGRMFEQIVTSSQFLEKRGDQFVEER